MTENPLAAQAAYAAHLSADEPLYALVQDGNGSQPVECWPRTAEGAINAVNSAARLSLRGEPVTVLRAMDGTVTVLARFIGGWREGRTRSLYAPSSTAVD